ncbi:MAG TPA: lysyl oxidase family protein [Actinomycetota bacterium]|jgi:hypothetical protein|nr:lysyl oxidase family protein [Actinomycetota bacterium]
MSRIRTHGSVLVVVVLGLATLFRGGPPAVAGAPALPSIRLHVADSHITVKRHGNHAAYVDSGVYVTTVGGGFELHVSRPDYDTPLGLTQVDATTDAVLRTLPSDLLYYDWFGLTDFIHVTIRDADGHLVSRKAYNWCPNDWYRVRVNDDGPVEPTYPSWCNGMPLAMGTVWGIDDGWAVSPFVGGNPYGGGGAKINGPDGDYTLTTRIRPTYRDLLDIADVDAVSTITVTVETIGGGTAASHKELGAKLPKLSADVPVDTDPDPATLPDLQALASWLISVVKHKNHENLAFGATGWNAGPAPLTVEGFRQPDAEDMDAFQYFFDSSGAEVGKAPVGAFEWDDRLGHNHWHFEQFARYDLLDATRTEVVASKKQSFCIVPTDAVDLTLPGAVMEPWLVGLDTACGGKNAIWIREDLDAGWGDTYWQYVSGQSFNVTNLPNGHYFIRVTVNPTGDLYEVDSTNNVSLREVVLRGRSGHHRWVKVLPYHGIDTESCWFCF